MLNSNGATSFLEWISLKYNESYNEFRRLGGHDKLQKRYFLSFSAEWFDWSSSLTYKKYLRLPNQLYV